MSKMTFIHGWGCNASVFAPLLPFIDADIHLISYENQVDFERYLVDEIKK